MSRKYKIGDKVEIRSETPALNSCGQRTGYNIEKYSIGKIDDYNDRYTSKIEDDYAKIKIVSGDVGLRGKEVWIKASDFSNVVKKY